MKSPAIYKDKKGLARIAKRGGFTLIEMLVVVGILAILGSIGLFFSFDDLRGHTFHTNRDNLVSALQHARSQAVSNICRGNCEDGRPHGVYITPNHKEFIIFQGESYAGAENEISLEANENFEYLGLNEVVFAQLSGDVGSPGTITIREQASHRESIITINTEGQILWTN